jgi:hypothetical protein
MRSTRRSSRKRSNRKRFTRKQHGGLGYGFIANNMKTFYAKQKENRLKELEQIKTGIVKGQLSSTV